MRKLMCSVAVVGILQAVSAAPAFASGVPEALIREQSACTRGVAAAHAVSSPNPYSESAIQTAVNVARIACRVDELVASLHASFNRGSERASLEHAESVVLDGIERQVRGNLDTLRQQAERQRSGR